MQNNVGIYHFLLIFNIILIIKIKRLFFLYLTINSTLIFLKQIIFNLSHFLYFKKNLYAKSY